MLLPGDNFDEQKAGKTNPSGFLFGKNSKRLWSENGGKPCFGIGYMTENKVLCN